MLYPSTHAAKKRSAKTVSSLEQRVLPSFRLRLSWTRSWRCRMGIKRHNMHWKALRRVKPFTHTPRSTPLCQASLGLLFHLWQMRKMKEPLKQPSAPDDFRLPSLQVLHKKNKQRPSGPTIRYGHFSDNLGFRNTLRPTHPKNTFHLQKHRMTVFLKAAPLIRRPTKYIGAQKQSGSFPRHLKLKWLRPLPAFSVLPPLFRKATPPDIPLYDRKEWPTPWKGRAKLAIPSKWNPAWNPPKPKKKGAPLKTPLSRKQIIAKMKKARSFIRKDKFYEAIQVYRQIVAQNPQNIAALRTLGRVQVWLGQLKSARKTYGDLFTHSPGDVMGYLGMADLETKAGRWKQAIHWYQMYLRHKPNDQRALRRLARVAAKAKRKKLARASFSKILKATPKDREAKAFLAGRKLQKRFFLSFTLQHRFFHSGRVGQTLEPKFGVRFFDQVMILLGVRLDLRHLQSSTLFEMFPHAEAVWRPHFWPGFKLGITMGGSPLALYYPQFMGDINADIPFPFLKLPTIKFLIGYRFYQFPTRQSHLFVPGVLVKLFQFGFRLKYYMNINHLLEGNSTLLQHALFFQTEWQVLWWLVLRAGIGWGNFADYLLNAYVLPTFGPAAGTDVANENAFFFNLGAQIELPKEQFLILGYRYYQEAVTIFPGQPPASEVFFHTVTLAYRLYF